MSLPNNRLASVAQVATYLAPDTIGRPISLVDYELHGADLNDPSQGWQVRNWRLRYSSNNVLLSGAPYTTESVLFTLPGITELSLTFDQNVQPAVAYKTNASAFLWWYDATLSTYTTIELGATIDSMFLTLDDKRQIASTYNDMLLFYLKDDSLYYRQQRERFVTERLLKTFDNPVTYIQSCGMNRGLRMQLYLA